MREKLSPSELALFANALATPSGPDAVCSKKLELVDGISPSSAPSSPASPESGSPASAEISIAASSEDGADRVREKTGADLALFAAALSNPFRMAYPGSIKVKAAGPTDRRLILICWNALKACVQEDTTSPPPNAPWVRPHNGRRFQPVHFVAEDPA